MCIFFALIIHLFIETAAKKTSPSSLSKVEARLPVGHSGHSDTFLGFEYKETKLMMYHNIYNWKFNWKSEGTSEGSEDLQFKSLLIVQQSKAQSVKK